MCAKSAPDWGRRGTASVQSNFDRPPVSMRSNVPMVSPWGRYVYVNTFDSNGQFPRCR